MTVLSRSVYVLGIIDALVAAFVGLVCFGFVAQTYLSLLIVTMVFVMFTLMMLNIKGFYKIRTYSIKDIYTLFEGILIAAFLTVIILVRPLEAITLYLVIVNAVSVYVGCLVVRLVYLLYKRFFKPVKNILIVGAGQDGKLIAEEIQSRPELGMKVVGFLDDNMNTIAEEDSSIPILGLTCDTEAVIKDNNVDMVIIAVKSRMDANILTDLAQGIPMGVKVWRMPTFIFFIHT